MKYKVGNKVKIREDLKDNEIYGSGYLDATSDMVSRGGMIATITECEEDSYRIDVDNGFYSWVDEMFEDVEESEAKFKIGDKVRILTGSNSDKVATVKDVGEENGEKFYLLDIDWYMRGYYGHNLELAEREDDTKIINTDTKYERTVDVGFHLDHCGHRVIKNVWQGGWATECKERSVFFTTYDCKNQYTLPLSAIDWVIPHED